MPSSSSLDIPAYLVSSPIPYNTLSPLSGGTANFVHRLTSASHPSLILKYAVPYIATQPHIPLPVARMAFEHRALTQSHAHHPPSAHRTNIALPQVHYYNPENHFLVMDDMGSTTLKQAYPTLSATDLQTYGHHLGTWPAHLHASTRTLALGDNALAKTIARYPYTNLSSVASSFGFDPSLAERINAR